MAKLHGKTAKSRDGTKVEVTQALPDSFLIAQARIEQDAGRHENAVRLFAAIVSQNPTHSAAMHGLGRSHLALGQFRPAIQALEGAATIDPENAAAFIERGDALRQLGDHDAAVKCCSDGLALNPMSAHGYIVRGASRWALDLKESALADIRRAFVLRPEPEVQGLLATYLVGSNQNVEALVELEKVVKLYPGNAIWQKHLGNCHQIQGNVAAAFHAYHKAVMLDECYVEAYCDLCGLLISTTAFDLAKPIAQLTISLKPDLAEAHYNLGVILQFEGKEHAAIDCYRSALRYKPGYAIALVQLCVLRQRNCDWSGLRQDWIRVVQQTYRHGSPVPPFAMLATFDDPIEHLMCARVFAAAKMPSSKTVLSPYFPPPVEQYDRRVRIGYLSADFHTHATAHLIAEHFELHDRNRFDLFGYSLGTDDRTPVSARVRKNFIALVELKGLSHEEAARRIKADDIDILIDLKGYTLHSKAEILALRPAPIQVNFLGYPGTMGADFIDYVIADPIVLPMDQQDYYDEKIVHLPDCYQPNDRLRALPDPITTRAECGLPENAFVFCCFNYAYKISPEMFAIWMRILKAVPSAVIWLLDSGEKVAENLRMEATRCGIEADRLIFAKKLPQKDHLCRIAAADLLLDTLPYNAHTTASDALWVGLPVLTCTGKSFASRVAASLIEAVGMPELIVNNLEAYELEAVRLATSPSDLARLRVSLEAKRGTAALFDTATYTRHFEAALSTMATLRSEGEAPRSFRVARI